VVLAGERVARADHEDERRRVHQVD
jgi:hypothetical protein